MTSLVKLLLLALSPAFVMTPLFAEERPCRVSESFDPNQLLLISGELNGQPVTCVIDTGATHHGIDSSFEPILGRCRTYDSKKNIEICSPQHLQVRGLADTREAESVVLDLSGLREASGLEFDVVVGMPFLLDRILELDPAKQRFYLSTASTEKYDTATELSFDDIGRPCVPITVDGHEIIAMIDTGSNAEVTLEKKQFQLIQQNEAMKRNSSSHPVAVHSISGKRTRPRLQVDEVRVGGAVVKGCTIVESELNKIGLGLLSKLKIKIDLRTMHLELSQNP